MSPFVSIKFTPAGRTVSFLLPDLMSDVTPGEQMVVETSDGSRAFAPVSQGPGEVAWFGRETPAAVEQRPVDIDCDEFDHACARR